MRAFACGADLRLRAVRGRAGSGRTSSRKRRFRNAASSCSTRTPYENARVVYKRGADYDAAALATLKNLLRDHRNGEMHDMDPRLYDQLYDLALAAHCEPHYEIISGYRSPESNDKMSAKPGSGVAKKSLHMQGRALDVRLKNCECAELRDLALAAKQGGVGYYAIRLRAHRHRVVPHLGGLIGTLPLHHTRSSFSSWW